MLEVAYRFDFASCIAPLAGVEAALLVTYNTMEESGSGIQAFALPDVALPNFYARRGGGTLPAMDRSVVLGAAQAAPSMTVAHRSQVAAVLLNLFNDFMPLLAAHHKTNACRAARW